VIFVISQCDFTGFSPPFRQNRIAFTTEKQVYGERRTTRTTADIQRVWRPAYTSFYGFGTRCMTVVILFVLRPPHVYL